MSSGGGSYITPNRFHGASVGITERSGTVLHGDGCTERPVTIRSYSDGIRVGCSFISSEALQKIWDMHSKYLKHEDYVQHQAGY